MFYLVEHTLAADLVTSGTIALNYPKGVTQGHFIGSHGSYLTVAGGIYYSPRSFGLSWGANVTLTWREAHTLPAGSVLGIQLEVIGQNDGLPFSVAGVPDAVLAPMILIRFGSPLSFRQKGICDDQAISAAGNAVLDGTLASDGVVSIDAHGRAVQCDSTVAGDTTQVARFTGLDVYGSLLVEDLSLNGTTPVFGKKAFSRVTEVHLSAAMAGSFSAGTTNIFGIPAFLPSVGHIVSEMQDGVSPSTPGTVVPGDSGEGTATSGDVRGTYTPNAAPDGIKGYALLVAMPDPVSPGPKQYVG